MEIKSIVLINLDTWEEETFNNPYELYLDLGRNEYCLTTITKTGKTRHHYRNADKWAISYLR